MPLAPEIPDWKHTTTADRDNEALNHGALADLLSDSEDPREDIVRHGVKAFRLNGTSQPAVSRKHEKAQLTAIRQNMRKNIKYKGNVVFGSHGHTHVSLGSGQGAVRIVSVRPAEGGTHTLGHIVMWYPGGAGKGMYTRAFSPEQTRAWIAKWEAIDPEKRKELEQHIAESGANQENLRHQPQKLARMKAPAGGAIANNQFQKGGQFLPKAFQRIRDVVAKAAEWERKKIKLSLTPVLPPTIREQQTLTMPQLKSIEDEHGIIDRHRLSKRAKELPNGNISAKSDDVAGFLEHLTNKRLSKDKIGKLVKSGAIKPEEKLVYLMNHMVHDAGWFNLGSDAGKWYGADVDAFDKGLKKLTGMKPHQIVLAKAVLAATSGGNKPIPNTLAMLRAIKAGLPEYNEPALHDWLHRAAKLNPDASAVALRNPGRNMGEQLEWYKQFVAPHGKALADAGYKTNRVRIVKATGEHVGTKEDDDWAYSPNARELYRQHGRKGMVDINLPSTDQSGMIQAKGWTSRGAQVAENIRRIKHLTSVKGEEGAADWLQTDHTDQEFANIFGRTPNRGYIPKNEKLPGAFILGPKFGPFFMNLNGKGKHLTADLWFARTWNRYLGSLFSAPGKQVKAPTSTTERRQMFHVAKKAADKLGLRSVSELQAVLWYYEQNLWRWFGSNTPSQTYRDGINEALKQHGHEPV